MDISIPRLLSKSLIKESILIPLEEPHKQTVVGTKVGSEDEKGAFANRLNFETYNLGHLMMAAIVHRRATGKTTLLMQPFVPPISFVISMKPLPLNWPVTLSVLPIIWGSRNVPRHRESTLSGTVEEFD